MPAIENGARAGVEFGFAPPIILATTQAVRTDDGGAQVGAREFRLPRRGALDRRIERDVDRLVRQLGLVVVVHRASLRSRLRRRFSRYFRELWRRAPVPIEGKLHAAEGARPNDDGAEAKPALKERGTGDLAHADEHHAVAGRLADRTIRSNKFRLALRKQEELGTRYDMPMPPGGTRVGAHDRDAVGVVEILDQPGHVTVATAVGRVHEHQPEPRLTQSVIFDRVDLLRGHP